MAIRRSRAALLAAALAVASAPRAARAGDGDGGGGDATVPMARDVEVSLAPLRIPSQEAPRIDPGQRAEPPSRHGTLAPGGVALPAIETVAVNLVMLEWSRWVGDASWADVSMRSIGHNLRSGWVLDSDAFWINQFGHPYQGTWSHTAARSSGLGFWASTPFTVAGSALWEIAGETTLPSVNDQVTTTVAGIVLGEVLYRFAGALRAEGGTWNAAAATLLAPMAAINRELLGTSQAIAAPPSRWRLGLGGAAFTRAGSPGARAPLGCAALSFTYGLPGAEGLELDRPFDHFVVDLGWTASADPAATVRARGLVAGATFAGENARGVYGAFLSFDLDTPPGYRVSTSAIGFGTSAGARLGRGLALEWDAIGSAVLLGAGPPVAGPDAPGRRYEFGPGEQALLAVRLLAGDRATAGLTVRQYLVLGADGDRGMELIVHGSVGATVRMVGPHGVGVEVSRYARRAGTPDGVVLRQADSAVRVYYVLHGGA